VVEDTVVKLVLIKSSVAIGGSVVDVVWELVSKGSVLVELLADGVVIEPVLVLLSTAEASSDIDVNELVVIIDVLVVVLGESIVADIVSVVLDDVPLVLNSDVDKLLGVVKVSVALVNGSTVVDAVIVSLDESLADMAKEMDSGNVDEVLGTISVVEDVMSILLELDNVVGFDVAMVSRVLVEMTLVGTSKDDVDIV